MVPQLHVLFAKRWCSACKEWRPARLRSGMELRKAPRAHHSKRLGQCVARMDHDCATAFCKGFSTKHGAWPLQTCGF